jgi:hypothetical protein
MKHEAARRSDTVDGILTHADAQDTDAQMETGGSSLTRFRRMSRHCGAIALQQTPQFGQARLGLPRRPDYLTV